MAFTLHRQTELHLNSFFYIVSLKGADHTVCPFCFSWH